MSKRNREKPDKHPTAPPTPAPPLDEVVKAYAAQAAAADQLADVDTKHLETPTANPNVLGVLNTERDTTARERIRLDYERERLEVEADHQRRLDRHRAERRRVRTGDERAERAVTEGLADADEAVEQLGTIRVFEREASPAASSTSLTRSGRVWRREEFFNAMLGSALSAVGIAALLFTVSPLTAPLAVVVAVAVETVLTMRVVRLISQRAALMDRHKGKALSETGKKALGFLGQQILVLLAVSVLINIIGLFVATGVLGVIGVIGAASAAVASWSAAKVTVAVTETVRSNVKEWQGENWSAAREDLRARAAGAHIPDLAAPVRQEGPASETAATVVDVDMVRQALATLADEHVAALAERGTDALQELLNRAEPGSQSVGSATPGGDGGHPLADQAATHDEQAEQPALEGNRLKVWQAIQAEGVGVSNRRIATLTGMARDTARKHRLALEEIGFEVFSPDHERDSADQ